MDEAEKERQRLRNFIIFKMYATDEEIGDMAPYLLVITVVLVLIFFAWLKFG